MRLNLFSKLDCFWNLSSSNSISLFLFSNYWFTIKFGAYSLLIS